VKEKFVKGSVIDEGSMKALNPTIEGIPTESPETTISCGLNPTVEGIPIERPETTSCGLNPTVEGIPTEGLRQQQVVAKNPS
jgi:hypothetical protein